MQISFYSVYIVSLTTFHLDEHLTTKQSGHLYAEEKCMNVSVIQFHLTDSYLPQAIKSIYSRCYMLLN